MTIAEIAQQAQHLSLEDRKVLVKLLVDSFGVDADGVEDSPAQEHWGQSLNRLFDELPPIEWVDPEIDDPVEWVKRQRQKEADRLSTYWKDEQ
ncbi:MAG: hypothetical protein ACOYL5_09925 [Phototrophicaceae bacterium]|jgi:hypothetical protein